MALDDFKSDDSSSNSSSNSTPNGETDTSSESNDTGASEIDMSFYNQPDEGSQRPKMEREGPLSDVSMADLAQNADDVIEIEEDFVKLHSPITFLIKSGPAFYPGQRYVFQHSSEPPKASWDGRVFTCIGMYTLKVGDIPKEVAMLDVGTHGKAGVMKRLKRELDDKVTPDTEATIHFFSDTLQMRDLAQANDKYMEGSIVNRDKVASNVLRPNSLSKDARKQQELDREEDVDSEDESDDEKEDEEVEESSTDDEEEQDTTDEEVVYGPEEPEDTDEQDDIIDEDGTEDDVENEDTSEQELESDDDTVDGKDDNEDDDNEDESDDDLSSLLDKF